MIFLIKRAAIIFLLTFSLLSLNTFAGETVVIKVENGDTLINICEKYLESQTDWRKIARINRLANPNRIYPGQYLVIPVEFLKGIPIDGNVSFVKGVAEIYDGGEKKWKSLSLNDTILQGEQVRTAVDSSLEISYSDGVSLLMRENTIVDISRARSKSDTNEVYDFFLDVGRAVNKLRKSTGKEIRYKVHTPTAVAAARNTEFRVTVGDDAATRLEVLEGNVGVRSGKQEIDVPTGYGAMIEKGMAKAQQNKLLSPPVPAEILPLYRSMPMKFFFKPVPESDAMRIILARDVSFKNIVKQKRIGIHESFEVVGVDDGAYYLSGRSIDPYGLEGPSSAPIPIKVRVNPLPPFIQTPINGAQIKANVCKLSWLKVPDAVSYHIQVAGDPDFSKVLLDDDNLAENSFQTPALEYTTYYFRICSIAVDGYKGIWSDTGNFTLVAPPPAPPLEEPELGEADIGIRWQDLGEGMTYRFQLARTSDFKELLIDRKTDTPEIKIGRPEKSGTYYVRTQAMDTDGYTGTFSAPQSFKIERDYTPMAVLAMVIAWIAVVF
jgi:hypothetical protein